MNKNAINLHKWLIDHSTKSERKGAEIIFTHISGETSVLLLPSEDTTSIIPVGVEPLSSFYRDYSGASIGNTHILIGTNIIGGVSLSNGSRLPDLNQMTKQARELEIAVGKTELAFIAEAGWMFVYTIAGQHERGVLRKYDRDFGTVCIFENLDDLLESWWRIVQADL